jgi:hypothetical protein
MAADVLVTHRLLKNSEMAAAQSQDGNCHRIPS